MNKTKLDYDTYWKIPRDSGFQRREKQNLWSFPVLVDAKNPPSWKVMVPRNRFGDDSIEIVNHGRLDTILNNPSMNGLYRGTGIFRLAYSTRSEEARMQLVGVRIFKKEEYFRSMENKAVHRI